MNLLDLLPYLAVLSGPLTLLGLGISVFGTVRSKLRRAALSRHGGRTTQAPGRRLTRAWVGSAAVAALLAAGAWARTGDVTSAPLVRASCTGAVALTFDDGPDPAITPKVLARLDRFGVKATFFVVGKHIAYYPGQVREIHSRGHTVGNHTLDHARLPAVRSDRSVRRQLTRTATAIVKEGVPRPVLWRPPYKAMNRRVRALAGDMRPALWGVDSEDYGANRGAPGDMVETVLARVYDGAIVLLHDDHNRTALDALPRLIPALRDRGYCFGTLAPSQRWNDLGPGQGHVKIVGARGAWRR
jgi:peptidoglycan/xylan/chitin deacetylase (PgdA/CDA1 family)